jgi:sulfur carrier protein
MAAVILFGAERREFPPGKTIAEAVSSAGMYPDTLLFLINGVPVPMDTVMSEGMTVKALRVASGG